MFSRPAPLRCAPMRGEDGVITEQDRLYLKKRGRHEQKW